MASSAVVDVEVLVLLRSLPNLLGIFRILATPILVWLVLQNTSSGYYGAITLLLLMAASDIADGPLAPRLGGNSCWRRCRLSAKRRAPERKRPAAPPQKPSLK